MIMRWMFYLILVSGDRLLLELQHDRFESRDVLDVFEAGRRFQVDVKVAELGHACPLST